jgi:hypothetical protein
MALVINDRVKENSTTTGTGTFNLAGAVTGFDTFVAGIGDGNTTYYAIFLQGSAEWEVGLGTVTDASTDTLARTTVITSSNSDSAVDFSAGTKDVFCTLPASKAVYLNASGAPVGAIANVVEDTTPQLGGNLDMNGQDIVSTSNADIDIIPNGTGDVNLGTDTVQVGDNDTDATITTQGTGDLTLNTNNGTNSGTVTIADGANGNITLTPNGTGDVVLSADSVTVGDSGAAATLTSNGAGTLTVTTGGTTDLVLSTNSGTASGTITITDAANQPITLTPNGTGVVAIEGSMNPSVSSTGKSLVMGF